MAKAKKVKKVKKQEVGTISETFQKASDKVTSTFKDYNEKYLSKAIDKGRETVKEYNDKYLSKTIEKGKETFKEYNDKYVVKTIEKGKDYFEEPYNKISDKVEEVLSKSRDIEKDAMKKLDGFIENGKKFMYKLPMVEAVEKKMKEGINELPGMINMPSKSEIERLTLAMENLNTNIKTLKAQNIL